ncbi:MAG: MaoC family dehydratase N-terminal domain-containing protein [Nocardia sp.]|nr:MaoC family dehydratase N-terminal domain-containing protein [Nocardia sp.]
MHLVIADRIESTRNPIGLRYRASDRYVVTAQRIRAYAAAVHNHHPTHFSAAAAAEWGFGAVVAPPTFATLPWLRAAEEVLAILRSGFGSCRILHAEQTIRIGRALLAGDVVTTDLFFDTVERYPDFCSITITALLRDRDGAPLQTGTATLLTDSPSGWPPQAAVETLARHPRVVADHFDIGPLAESARVPRPPIDLSDHEPGTELRRRAVVLRPRDLRDYTALAGSFPDSQRVPAGICTASGLFRLAMTCGAVTTWLDDPAVVRALRAEFSHPEVGETTTSQIVEFRGRVAGAGADSTTIDLDTRCHGRRLFARAEATVRTPHAAPDGY